MRARDKRALIHLHITNLMDSINTVLSSYFDSTPDDIEAANRTAGLISAQFDAQFSSPSATSFSVESFLWCSSDSLWDSLLRHAIGHEPQAVKLLLALSEQKTDTKATIWGAEFDWANLPLFGPHVRESFNGPLQHVTAREELQTLSTDAIYARFESSFTTYRSLTILLSLLFAYPSFGWVHRYCIWQIRSSPLESPLGSDTTLAEWMFDLELALIWLKMAGKSMRHMGDIGRDDKSLRTGELWKEGQGGWSEARWEFWELQAEKLGRDDEHEMIRQLGLQVKETVRQLRRS